MIEADAVSPTRRPVVKGRPTIRHRGRSGAGSYQASSPRSAPRAWAEPCTSNKIRTATGACTLRDLPGAVHPVSVGSLEGLTAAGRAPEARLASRVVLKPSTWRAVKGRVRGAARTGDFVRKYYPLVRKGLAERAGGKSTFEGNGQAGIHALFDGRAHSLVTVPSTARPGAWWATASKTNSQTLVQEGRRKPRNREAGRTGEPARPAADAGTTRRWDHASEAGPHPWKSVPARGQRDEPSGEPQQRRPSGGINLRASNPKTSPIPRQSRSCAAPGPPPSSTSISTGVDLLTPDI